MSSLFVWGTESYCVMELNLLVKAMVFPVFVYGCESWTMKKTEGRRIDGFELCL